MKLFVRFFVAAYIAAGCAATSHAATSSCRDEAGPGGNPGSWVATYTFSNTRYGPVVNFTSLGFQEDGSSLRPYESFVATSNTQWIFRWEGNPDGLRGDTQAIMAATPGALLLPRLTTPDKRCSLQIAPYAFSQSTGPEVAIIGDSLVASYTSAWQDRQRISNHIARVYGWRFHVDAVAGRLLASNTIDRVGGGGGMKEIMGALATRPTALVIALSTNDALANAVVMDCSEGTHPVPALCQDPGYSWVSRRQRSINLKLMLEDIAAMAARQNVCLVFVTPQTDHADATELGYMRASARNYDNEATNLRQHIMYYNESSSRRYPQARIGFMDWANIVTGSEYRSSDNLHLNTAGKLVHLASWLKAVRSSCGI